VTTPPVLSVSNLTTSFLGSNGWREVVSDVSFDVKPGETVAVVGESGSGKSVTALSIMRLLDRDRSRITGSVRLEGQELLKLPEAAMRDIRGRRIGMIFQEPMTSLNPVLTVGVQIAETLKRHMGISRGDARREAIRLMDKVHIPSAASRFSDYPNQFSGGMRQRIMIAMALACGPRLLIADEPTTALDVTVQAQILELIRELQREQDTGVLFITHDMGVVAEISDRTLVMYRGACVEAGDTDAIFARPANAYTRALLSAVPRLGSMSGRTLPARFPLADHVTGELSVPPEVEDTVQHDAEPIVTVENLSVRFAVRSGVLRKIGANIHAVEDLSFSVRRGETLGIVGESGSGKSTTGRAVLGLQKRTGGQIRLHGVRDAGIDRFRRELQMIFQDPFASLNPKRPIGRAIADPLVFHDRIGLAEARRRAEELLVTVGLPAEVYDRFPNEFSGGQRQRICIARALALQPELIIADEAVSALDASVKAQIINLMLDLQQARGLAYIFISHDMAVVERICHRVAVMLMGEIVEIGPRKAVFDDPQHPYTKRLMAAVPIPDPARRYRERSTAVVELKSAMRPVDWVPPRRAYREVAPDHFVQIVEE